LAKLKLLTRRSDALIERRIERLDDTARSRLVECATEIRRLLDDPVEIQASDPVSPEARACLAGYFAELDRRFPQGFDPARSVSADPDETRPPSGVFVVVSCGGLPRGCGALKTLSPGVGEIKRMWLHPELRGRGVGRKLLEALEDRAGALGLRVLRLDTSSYLEEAIALYRSNGYLEVAPYNDNRYAAWWFEKHLEVPDEQVDSSKNDADPSPRRLRTARGRAVSSGARGGRSSRPGS
jgi:GNAT superfamily N-acetyltransferase